MKFNFDRRIDRSETFSVKYSQERRGMPGGVIPMWIADMDFQAPPCVTDALEACVRHGIFGYSEPDDGYFDAVTGWLVKRFNWKAEREWITVTQGVVNSIYVAIRALSEPGDGVVIQQPVYNPFESAIKDTGRAPLINELVYKDGRYEIDLDCFEALIKRASLFILCSPHNPVGRVWTREELEAMGDICLKHGVTVVADEIHQDFVYPGNRHLVFAGLDKRFSDIAVTCASASKTFNIAGLPLSNIIVENPELRGKFRREYSLSGLGQAGVMGIAATKAAYGGGADWVDELLLYLGGNMALIHEFLTQRLPRVGLVKPEGTYLAWLDFRGLGLPAPELRELITRKAGLWLNGGEVFGPSGAGFQRMNAACPRATLTTALERLEAVFANP